MTIDELNEAHGLLTEIKSIQNMLAAYRQAESITVGISSGYRLGTDTTQHRIELTASEIQDAVIAALEARVADKMKRLTILGVEQP